MRKWLPYAPADAPDVWRDVYCFLPSRSGSYYTPNIFAQLVGAGPASPGTTLRAWAGLLASDAAVSYIGTTTKLYQWDGSTTFTDRSKGGGYTNTATDWSFAQYGDITFAVNRVDAVQTRDSSGGVAFADATGSPPKARIVVTQSDQVLLFDLNDGAEKPNAFAACAPGDYTDWSGAGATTATPIRHRPGKITAAVAYRDHVLVAKRSSVYRLTYTGNNTYKWKVELIATNIGATGQHDMVVCGDTVLISGRSGIYRYDGTSFRSVSDYLGYIAGASSSFWNSDTQNACFFMYYGGGSGRIYAYNLVSDRWGYSAARTASLDLSSTTSHVGLSGEWAAFVTLGLDAYDGFVLISLSTNPCVYKDSAIWGNGSVAALPAYMVGSIEGKGGREITNFVGLDLDIVRESVWTGAIPDATELRLDIYTGDSKDADSLVMSASPTPTQSNINSETAQKRFNFMQGAVYARFKIKVPDSAGHVQLRDYTPRIAKGGGEL